MADTNGQLLAIIYSAPRKNGITMQAIAPRFMILAVLISLNMAGPLYSQTFQLTGWHQSVSCLQEITPQPPVTNHSNITLKTLTYTDEYFRLGCTATGFQGYFSPSRWQAEHEKGDGGVDVTGAPNSVLVEGANSASVVMLAGSSAAYKIAIPATGYAKFNWSYIGGSNLLDNSFYITINDEPIDQLKETNRSGTFFSGLLQAGDYISLHGNAPNKGFKIKLSNFEFISNTIAIYEREWTALDANNEMSTFIQHVSVKKPDLSTIVFPSNYDGYHLPVLDYSPSVEPEWTGYPVFDIDGSNYTSSDQFPLEDALGTVEYKWEDEYLYEGGFCIIYRHWTISDYCGGNTVKHTQILKMAGGCPDGTPEMEERSIPPHLLQQVPAVLPEGYEITHSTEWMAPDQHSLDVKAW